MKLMMMIEIPMGLMIAFCICAGIVILAIFLVLAAMITCLVINSQIDLDGKVDPDKYSQKEDEK